MEIENLEQFQNTINEDKITAVDFFATWCGPCKMLGPVFVAVSQELNNSFNFLKVDIDKFNEVASLHGIQSVPTIVYFKNGKEIDRTVGFIDSETLKEKLHSLV